MGWKEIFREGMKERKRRRSLRKVNSEFREKEKAHAAQLAALGQKAWEGRIDLSAHSDLRAGLSDAQKALDDLRSQAGELQQRKRESEENKRGENERLAAAQKDIEGRKRKEDGQLNDKKAALLGDQKESQRALSRLAAIARERSQLQNKGAGPAVTDAEKREIDGGMSLLAREEEELKAANQTREAAGRPLAAAIAAIQEESNQLQKLLDELRQEQKKTVAELDKQLAALNGELAANADKAKEADERRKVLFKGLGERLAAAQGVPGEIAGEMAAVLNARTEMQGVQALIGGLERQKDEGQARAYRRMKAILVAGALLAAAILALLLVLLAPKKKEPSLGGLAAPVGAGAKKLEAVARP